MVVVFIVVMASVVVVVVIVVVVVVEVAVVSDDAQLQTTVVMEFAARVDAAVLNFNTPPEVIKQPATYNANKQAAKERSPNQVACTCTHGGSHSGEKTQWRT